MKEKFSNIKCEVPKTIWPVLVHTKHQKLIESITLGKGGDFGKEDINPNISVRLPGLINISWPLNLGKGNLNEGTLVYEAPVNPPVTVSPKEIKRDSEVQSQIEIVAGSNLKCREEVILQPPAAFPIDFDLADALAAFVMPGVPEVVELVRRAMERSGEPYKRLGFPNMTPVKASEILYREIVRSEQRYTWEPAPWSSSTKGQVIRLPRRILVEGEATCIDLALLLCSAIEHMRRLPVILGVCIDEQLWHVIPGVRVNDDDEENQPLISNLDAVKNSCLPKRTVLFDPDALIRESEPRDADASARQLLKKAAQAFLVDVQAARNNGIWPLPIADPPRVRPIPQSVFEEPLIMDSPEGVPDELAEEVARGRVVVLLGDVLDPEAAVSSHEFARVMSNEAGFDEPDLLLAGSIIEKKNGIDILAQKALRLLNSKGHEPTAHYLSFAQLSIQTVVSFYPDPVLEHILLNQDPPFQLLIEDDDLAAFKTGQGNRVLYLLGGSALTGKGLVLTIKDHNRLLKRIEVLARGLRDRLALQTLLLIGGDMSDLNLKELYLEATKHLGNSRTRPIYVVSAANPGKWFRPCHILKQKPQELFEELSLVVPVSQPTIKPPISPPTQIRKKRSPYKYLDYFESEDADLFFGREEEWSHISREIMASPSRVTVLCGRSGVGKTSLVKARLIPRLKQDKDILPTYTRFGKDPETSIFNALQTHIIKQGIKEKIPPGDIKAALRILFHNCHREHVIFLDQTEEAFIKLGKALLDSFFRSIRECVSGTNTGTYVVFVIREDYLGWLAKHRDQFPGLLSSVCLLQELTHESAREAIIKPAEICGLQVEDTLVEEVLDDLSPDSILPAHLQIVCDRIYQESNRQVLTLETYKKVGRAARILRGHLEEAMSRLPVELESTARKVLRAMVTSEHTKDLLSLEQIVKRIRLPIKQVEAAVHDLIHAQRLIREVPGDRIRFEFSHESLTDSVTEWLEEKELRIREIQEMLEQEVSNAKKFKGFQFPLDKLRLIDEHREYLDLDKDSINVVVKTFLKSGQLPEFWMIKGVLYGSEYYMNAGIKLIFEEVLENALISILESLIEVSESRTELLFKSCKTHAEKSQGSMDILNTLLNNPVISAKLADEVFFGSSNSFEIIIETIFIGSSGNTLAALISGLDEEKVPDKRAELILKICKLYGENHQPLFLRSLEKQKLNTLFLNRIIKCELHHWPSVLRFLLEGTAGSEVVKILLLRDEPKVVQIILKFLRDNISDRLNRTCIEFIENIQEPYALIELLKALKNNKNNRSKPVRSAILDALDKNMKTVTNAHLEIVDLVICNSRHFIDDERVRLRHIIKSCLPKVRSIVEAAIENNDNFPNIQGFARLILEEYDNSQRMSPK
jgi:hypothetical protein